MKLEDLKKELAEIHSMVLELAAQRHAKKKEMVAACYGIQWGNTIGVTAYPNTFDVVFDDMKESPYLSINKKSRFHIHDKDKFVVRRILKNGKPSERTMEAYNIDEIKGCLNSDANTQPQVSREKLNALCDELNDIHVNLIQMAKKRHEAWEAVYQAENGLIFGKSIVNHSGKEFLIKGCQISEFVLSYNSYQVIASQILSTGKVSNKEKIITLTSDKEVRRLA